MPMKWTPDKDQLMFMMLLKTHNISINYGAIAQAWPDDQGEKPTPRAISERLIKMRKLVSASSNGSAAAVVKPRSVNSTPSKPKPVRPPVSGGGASTPSNKRRRVDDDDRTISRQELRELGIANRTSPTPRQAPAPVMAARHSTVASTVMPTSETSPPRTFGSVQAPPSRAPTAASARPSAAPAVAATTAQRSLSANAQAFAARTPVSMEPTAGLARLSVTPGGGSVRPTPRRGTSVLAPIKLEDSGDDDDALQPYDFEDDSDVSDWAEEV
ncbi:uncharacterized protein LTHEOB_3808 [Lasiodiplodia theobromae]|uniref:uncharacterized protein n=1 Tax=Lasiodiplodia theobromae TaxID=45133 RepID=UPI0015C37AC3|nr:uncharacterized protein LTHEOB_3808 [Lasiodiplodia theobromae]KAF4546500.1 hypothetical protein LTHEOB_3808 [Lasiodiplodia theobromae]